MYMDTTSEHKKRDQLWTAGSRRRTLLINSITWQANSTRRNINCHNYSFSFTVPCQATRLTVNCAIYMDITTEHKKRDQLGTAGSCHQLEFAIAAHRPGRRRSQQQYNDKFITNLSFQLLLLWCYYIIRWQHPKTSFIVGQQRQQLIGHINNSRSRHAEHAWLTSYSNKQ